MNAVTPTPGPSHPQSASAGLSPRSCNPWPTNGNEKSDSNGCKNKNKELMDVDSGIENMEVEECDRKENEMSDMNRVSSSNETSFEQVIAAMGRVLCGSWNEDTDETLHLSKNVTADNEESVEPDYQDIISQSLMEILHQFADGDDNPLKALSVSSTAATSDSPSSPSASQNAVNLTPLPQSSVNQESIPKQNVGLHYLMNCYSRVAIEERNHPKVSYFFICALFLYFILTTSFFPSVKFLTILENLQLIILNLSFSIFCM